VESARLVATPEVGFRAAGWFWTHEYRLYCLNGRADARDFDEITRKVNGGLNGKASRDAYYQVAKRVLGIPEP
jgi:predicted chitinase